MVESFRSGRQLYLVIRNERASENYTLDVLAKIFAQEGRGLYDVRHAAIGHLQQGGDPSADFGLGQFALSQLPDF